ncbi:MAG: hypothetical protein A2074_08625 [Candidatus Aquicultor primus]|uniref:Potassium channel protein n=1 Tax=Candidatus Aquicultor primus TaxID=1797195 RepID=A0A1F2UUV7_9ACTN|nr:MAG: hypothetical protein A2074_08625 [Candidatus Aquicultor primus]
MKTVRHLWLALGLLSVVVIIGVMGYMVIEGWSFRDALFMTIISITTVGYGIVKPLTVGGTYFTMLVVLAGTGTAFYVLVAVVEFMVEGHLSGYITEKRVEKTISKLEEHYIICGFGRVGENVAEEFSTSRVLFVVIENKPERVEECREYGYLCIEGDASSDEVLLAAGVERAQGLVAAVDSDADNVFVTLTARVLNQNIKIVARSSVGESIEKLQRAGANKVVSPSIIGGKRMAAMLLRPVVTDYLDVVTYGDGLEFRLEELKVSEGSSIKGKTIGEADLRRRTGAVVLAIKKNSGGFNTSPDVDTTIELDDELVIIGTQDQIEAVIKCI